MTMSKLDFQLLMKERIRLRSRKQTFLEVNKNTSSSTDSFRIMKQ